MTKNKVPAGDLEVLVFATVQKDAELTVNVLGTAGFKARTVSDVDALSREMLTAGAVILSEESLSKSLLEQLRETMSTQPHWSDLPIIIVTSGGGTSFESNARLEWIATFLNNITLLERPIRLATLITIVRAALSSRKKQFELKAILEELERSKREADEANQAKSIFLANMSHEIRTPLAAIVGFSGLMRDEKLPVEERLQFAQVVARNGDQLSSLINDILDLSKVEAGKLEIDNAELSFPVFFAEIISLLRPVVEAKGHEFRVEIKSKLPADIVADSTRIRQILLNLVSNAAKFTSQGVVKVLLTVEPITDFDVKIRFEVCDTGIGISEQDQSRIFKPFAQADPSVTRKYGGTGLGLVLSKALANAMGGDLQLVDSSLGKGSKFELSLPVRLTQSRSRATNQPQAKDVLLGMRVLVAEDSPDNQFLMNRYLQNAGAEVVTVENGKMAVEHALDGEFHVILMDIQMPVLDGLSATKELREREYSGTIIALTAHALREEKERSLNAGCNDHLTKPIDREALIATLASYRA